jgi:hypothetical protein
MAPGPAKAASWSYKRFHWEDWMKKLGVALLAVAFSMPFAFAAKQETATKTTATTRKASHKVKKSHVAKKKPIKTMKTSAAGK